MIDQNPFQLKLKKKFDLEKALNELRNIEGQCPQELASALIAKTDEIMKLKQEIMELDLN